MATHHLAQSSGPRDLDPSPSIQFTNWAGSNRVQAFLGGPVMESLQSDQEGQQGAAGGDHQGAPHPADLPGATPHTADQPGATPQLPPQQPERTPSAASIFWHGRGRVVPFPPSNNPPGAAPSSSSLHAAQAELHSTPPRRRTNRRGQLEEISRTINTDSPSRLITPFRTHRRGQVVPLPSILAPNQTAVAESAEAHPPSQGVVVGSDQDPVTPTRSGAAPAAGPWLMTVAHSRGDEVHMDMPQDDKLGKSKKSRPLTRRQSALDTTRRVLGAHRIIILYIPALFITLLTIWLTHVPQIPFDTADPTVRTAYLYQFFHENNLHVISNLITLAIYGGLCEYEQGPFRTILIHVICVFWGAVGSFWEARILHDDYTVVGASGGVYGLLASLLGFLAINWTSTPSRKRAVYLLLVLSSMATDIFMNVLMSQMKEDLNVAYGAHVGGFIGGIFAGIAFSRNDVPLIWEWPLRVFCGSISFGAICSMFMKDF